MAIDNGIVVAISSIATAIIAGSITILSKLIDAFQKKNEQSLIIKTTYINKKIEAGQKFVGENNIRITSRILLRRYLKYLKVGIGSDESFIADYNTFGDKLLEISLSKDNFIFIYFNIEEHITNNYIITDELNQLLPLIEPDSVHCRNENYSENLDKAIELVNSLLDSYRYANKLVREDLNKYDITL